MLKESRGGLGEACRKAAKHYYFFGGTSTSMQVGLGGHCYLSVLSVITLLLPQRTGWHHPEGGEDVAELCNLQVYRIVQAGKDLRFLIQPPYQVAQVFI